MMVLLNLHIPLDQTNERQDNHLLNNSSSSNEEMLTGEYGGASMRYRKLTDIYNSCSFALTTEDPIFYEDAPKSKEWIVAMEEEMEAINRNHTWSLTTLPEGKK